MKVKPLACAALLALAAGGSVMAAAQEAPPKPMLDISTMLFLMLVGGGNSDALDPIDINAFDIVFDDGNSANDSDITDEIDVLLHDK
jgi:hypothetical protein